MATFEIDWSCQGRVTVEADDRDEAEQLVTEGLYNFDTTMFESFDVDEASVDEVKESNED